MATPRIRRAGVVAGLAVLGIGTVVLSSLLLLPVGARLAVGFLGSRLSMTMSVVNIDGRLIGPLRLRGVNLAGDGFTIIVEEAFVDWRPLALLRGSVAIDRVAVSGVRVVLDSTRRQSDGGENATLSTPPDTATIHLPIQIDFDSVIIDKFTLVIPGQLHVDSGRVRLSGSADDYQFEAHGRLSGRQVLPSSLSLSGRGSLNALALDTVAARTDEGRAVARGSFAWRPFLQWDAAFAADSVAPAALFPDPEEWPGTVTINGSSRGRVAAGQPQGRLVVDTVLGTLRGRPLNGRLTADFAGSSIDVEALALNWGNARVEAVGAWGDSVRGRFELVVPSFNAVHPRADGALTSRGEVSGAPGNLRIDAAIDGTMLRWDDIRLNRLAGRITAATDSLLRGDVDLLVAGFVAGGIAVDSLVLVGGGTSLAHEFMAGVRGPRGAATVVAGGRWHDAVWSGQVDRLELAGEGTGRWSLTGPAILVASPDSARLKTLCVAGGGSSLCAEGSWSRQRPWSGQVHVDSLPLGLFSLFMPPRVALTGSVAGRLAVEGAGGVAASDMAQAIRRVVQGATATEPAPGTDPELHWDANLVIARVAAGIFGLDEAQWPGSVTIEAASEGRLTGGRLVGHVVVDTILGHIRDAPLHGLAAVHIDGTALSLDSLSLTMGSGTIEAAGRWADRIAGHWDINLPSLDQIHPRLAGSMRTTGEISGTPEAVAADALLDGSGLAWDSLRADGLTGRVAVTVDSAARGEIDAHLLGVVLGRWNLDSLALHGAGSANGHRFQGELRDRRGDVLLQLGDGRWHDGNWRGTIERLDLGAPGIGRWRLSNPAELALSSTAVHLDSMCLLSPSSSFCAEGRWMPQHQWYARSTIRALPLALMQLLLPEGVSLTGTLDGDLSAESLGAGATTGLLTLSTSPGEMVYHIRGQDRRVQFAPASLRSALGTEGLMADAGLHLQEDDGTDFGMIDVHLELPRYHGPPEPLGSQPLGGTLEARVFDASLLQALDPDIAQASGAISASLRLGGDVGTPVAIGDIRYVDGTVAFQDLGITVNAIQVVASGDRTGGLAVTGTMQSGRGALEITGSSPLIPDREHPARLTIKGTDFQIVNTPQANVVVSPDLVVHIVRDSIDVSGEVTVVRATIELTDVPETATKPSGDVVYLDAEAEETPLTITSRVRVVLGDSVSFQGFGFRGQLSGSFEASDRPPLATRATGEITIERGRYRAYGQDLRIEDGRIAFNGAIDDPLLDVKAFREARDRTIAGLEIRGSLKEPDVSVYSNPPMSESEAMSYLVFGRSLDQGNASEQAQVSQAATGLGGDILAQSLGAKVGLEAGIEQGANPNEASVVAGTYLSPQLFVAYGVGLFERVNIFRVRYEFTRRWSVQAESSQESSGDVFFTFERGH